MKNRLCFGYKMQPTLWEWVFLRFSINVMIDHYNYDQNYFAPYLWNESKITQPNGSNLKFFFHPMLTNCVHAKNDVGQNCSLFGKKHWKPYNISLDTYNAVSTTLTKKFRQKADNFLLNVRKWWNIYIYIYIYIYFSKKLFFVKLFFWTRRMQ